jgi:multidrug resistance efflux pump
MSEHQASVARPESVSYKPIPTPFWVRWREFRVALLPMIVFSLIAAACFILWSDNATSSGVAGIAEGMRSAVSSPRVARVQEILVKPYQEVNAGDPIAIVLPIDPRAELGLFQTELNLARIGLQPSLAEENVMNFEQIRVDVLRTKAELAIARVNLERMDNQVRRNEPLFRDQLLSEDLHDLAVKTRDAFRAEVIEKSNAVAQIEKRLGELEAYGSPLAGATNANVAATLSRLNLLRQQVATNWMPITLRAPISGMVSGIGHQPGETALEGEAIVSINSLISDRVIGYLRQPYPVDPYVGMEVMLTTRERKPRRFEGSISHIGAQIELITNALAFIRPGSLVDAGLPIAITVPPEINVRPGEIVDLTFRYSFGRTNAPVAQPPPGRREEPGGNQHARK